MPRLMAGICAAVAAIIIWSAAPARAAAFEVREYGGVPCLWQNGLPYFTRFAESDRTAVDLAGEWSFITDPEDQGEAGGYAGQNFDASGWEKMPVPGVWNPKDSKYADYIGAAWYRREFNAPEKLPAGLCRLYFDGVAFHGKVWLNGTPIGEHSGGYTGWSLDATRAIRPGANVIVARVDNRRGYTDVPPKLWEGEKLGWWPYGGIARTARVEWSPRVSVTKLVVQAYPLANGGGMLSVSGLVFNYGAAPAEAMVSIAVPGLTDPIRQDLLAVKVTVPARDCASFNFPGLVLASVKPWSNSSANLYPLTITAAAGAADRVTDRIGFRKFEVGKDSLYLNGRPYFLRGINRHEDDPATGLYQSDERMNQDMALVRELHVNHMRPAHYPNDPRWLDLCDRAGVTITHEIPLYQAGSGIEKWAESKIQKRRQDDPNRVGGDYHTLRQMEDPELIASARLELIEMIERDRVHPSVIMWSVGNENFTFIPSARGMYEQLIATARRFDPDRPVTFALLVGPGVSPLLEQTGDLADVISLNEYYGWYFGKAQGVAKMLDRFHQKYPDKLIIVSEFGAGTVAGRHADPPEKFSEEYQKYFFETQFPLILQRPWVVGTMPWVFADFRCPWFGPEHPVPGMNLKGLVDYNRNQKAAFNTVAGIYAEIEKR
ncbi:MAG TPA: glycoside hydrolase family 2 TIM barrel-domain containing protein [bacterium]|nr:glycoside hydrolase family 2 TIM barrel-domain containing protein [bacterium]